MNPFSFLRTAALLLLLAAALPHAARADEPVAGEASAPAAEMPAAILAPAPAVAEAVAPEAELAPAPVVLEHPSLEASASVVLPEPAPAPAAVMSSASEIDVLPHIAMLPDAGGSLDAAAVFGRLGEARPYGTDLFQKEAGAVWFHLDLGRTGDAAPHTLWLDLAMQTPYGTKVLLSSDGKAWKEVRPDMPGLYPLREAGREGHVLVRMNGLPGFWFHPVLRSLDTAMHSPERPVLLAALTVMAVLGLLNLLSSVTHRGESRFWLFILAAAAMVQALWGIPAVAAGIFGTFPGVFAAGVALFVLPHVGRMLMQTGRHSPSADMLFLLFALPGACAAIVPLLPGLGWTGRLLVFWPLASLLCVLPSLVQVFRGIAASGPFTLACLSMGGGGAISLWGLTQGVSAPLWGLAVPAGSALGLLFLTAAAPLRERADAPPAQDIDLDLQPEASVQMEEVEAAQASFRRSARSALEALLDEACRLDQALTLAGVEMEKADIMAHADAMVAVARRLSDLKPTAEEGGLLEASEQVFELRKVIKDVFASVYQEAEKKGLGLSWYVAPHLGQLFRGDSARLTALLALLLTDSIRASSRGAVSLHVRRAAESAHPGHLQFTVADSGRGRPPHGRHAMLPARVWELASAWNGDLSLENGRHGMILTFSMECAAVELPAESPAAAEAPAEGGEGQGAGSVILASSDGMSRQMYAYYLAGMGFHIREARDAQEASALYAAEPAALLVLDGSLPEDDMAQCLAAVRMHEGEHALEAVPFLMLAHTESQASRMAKAGCDQALVRPVIRKDLRAMVKWLASPAGSVPRPVLTSQRVTLAAVLAGADAGALRLQRKAARRFAAQDGGLPAAEGGPAAEGMAASAGETEAAEAVAPQDITMQAASESEAAVDAVPAPEALAGVPAQAEDKADKPRRQGWFSSLFHASGEAPAAEAAASSADMSGAGQGMPADVASGGEPQAAPTGLADEAETAGPAETAGAGLEGILPIGGRADVCEHADASMEEAEGPAGGEVPAFEPLILEADPVPSFEAEGVVDLRAEDVVPEESGILELRPEDRAPEDALPAGAEVLELGQDAVVGSGKTEAPAAEDDIDLEAPLDAVLRGLDQVALALAEYDVQGIRRGSRQLAAIADGYGMHTLADMARCFRVAWEEGDVEAAAQIIEEMRAETARQF